MLRVFMVLKMLVLIRVGAVGDTDYSASHKMDEIVLSWANKK